MTDRGPGVRRARVPIAAAALLLACAGLAATPERVHWTPTPNVLFVVDGRPVKLWTLYHAAKDKKEHRLLLQIATRYLMIDTQLRLITEYDPAAFEQKGRDCEMPREAKSMKALPTEDWILRDMGTSFLIETKLKEEGRVLEIHLPKMPDFRNVLW